MKIGESIKFNFIESIDDSTRNHVYHVIWDLLKYSLYLMVYDLVWVIVSDFVEDKIRL